MDQNKQKFNEVLPEVMDTLMTSPKFTNQLPEVKSWVEKLLNHIMDGGKEGKELAVPFAYQKMEDPKYFTDEKLHSAQFFECCVEMLMGCLILVDDIIDASTKRRGKPCWHLQPNVGTSAINDCFLIYHCVMEVIEIKFGKEPFYSDLVDITNEAFMYTTIGQYLDYSSGYNKEKNNLNGFTMERYNAIAVQKAGYYIAPLKHKWHYTKNGCDMFRLPMLAALLLVRNGKERDTTELSSICLEFGKLLQLQNDYEEIYWDEAKSGKIGTDIQEGKLTWIAVKALERCNEAQRSIFKEYYGSKDPEHAKRIKQLYDELQIDKEYEKFKNSEYICLERRIRALPTEEETEFFLEIMEACRKQIYVLN